MHEFLKAEYNYDTREESKKSAFHTSGKTRVQQNQKEEADINTIVRRFGLTGQLPTNLKVPMYGDFSDITDYQSALNLVKEAEKSFLAMPADIRKRFNHDPQEFVAFCSDEKNKEEMVKLGIAVESEPADEGGVSPTEGGGTPASVNPVAK